MTFALELTVRMVGAALFGAAIGYEREVRGKGAGVRTHLLVALGSALFMIISQYGFGGSDKFDAARVAAGVVGGLGFLGGGIIMKNRHISGLTTAAGLWVTGAMGLAMGTILVLICMEALHFYSTNLGERQVNVTLSGKDEKALAAAIESLGKDVSWFSLNRQEGGFKAEIGLLVKKKEKPIALLERLSALSGVQVENME